MPEVNDGTPTSGNPKAETYLLAASLKATPPPRAFTRSRSRQAFNSLCSKAQRHPARINWARMNRIATRWIPQTRTVHPFSQARFAATHPR
jgi:hypothetical protein